MTPLRKRMIEEMKLRNFAPKTIEMYVQFVARFARHFGKSPELLGEEHVRQYLVHLVEEKKMAWGTYNQALASLRYLYRWVLKRGDVVRDIRGPRRVRRLPVVLSLDEVRRFFAEVVSYKHRMMLMTAYSAGLRISEVVNLQVSDIDSQRMVIHVRQQHLLCASLASGAFMIYLDPEHQTNAVRTLVLSQIVAAGVGTAVWLVLGSGYAAAGIAMSAAIFLMVVFNFVHPPAITTALAFSLRPDSNSGLALFGLAIAVTAALLLLQRAVLRLVAGRRVS